MLRRLRHLVSVASLAVVVHFASTASAGSLTNGTISSFGVAVQSGNLVYVFFTTTLSSPACPTSSAVVFDSSTADGKARLNLLTSAWLAGKRVTLNGNGTCTSVIHGFPAAPYSIEGLNALQIIN
jgi:hypothetical protein